jgi:hypothetical protein
MLFTASRLSLISLGSTNSVALAALQPVTVAQPSKACTLFSSLGSRDRGFESQEGMDVWYAYGFILYVCVIPCLGRGLETS